MNVLTVTIVALQLSVALTVFGFGLDARADDVLSLVRAPRLLVVSLLAMFVVMPVVALALELYLGFPHATRVALVVLALTPIPALLPRNQIGSGGTSRFAYGLSFAVALLSIVLVPLLTRFLGDVMRRPFSVPLGTVAQAMVVQVLAPLALGVLVSRLIPGVAHVLRPRLPGVANAVLGIALLVLLVLSAGSLVQVATWRTVVGMALFIAAGLGVGHVMGGPRPADSVVLALACANRNPGLAIGIASANFPAENFVATMVLYGLLVGVVTKPYLRWARRRTGLPATVQHDALGPV